MPDIGQKPRSTIAAKLGWPASRFALLFFCALLLGSLTGCQQSNQDPVAPVTGLVEGSTQIQLVNVGPVVEPVVVQSLAGARNETLGFAISLGDSRGNSIDVSDCLLRIRPPKLNVFEIPVQQFSFFQIVPMTVELNRAAYVRQTGQSIAIKKLPRALVPLTGAGDTVDLRGLHTTTGPVLIWVDLRIPRTQMAGNYTFTIETQSAGSGKTLASRSIALTIHDLTLPDARHLQMISTASWDAISRLWPDRFTGLQPRLLSRLDSRHGPAVRTLDDLMKLAEEHRLNLSIGGLTPDVKYPPGQEPQVDWRDYDTLISPWMEGTAFADKTPLAFWPLPPAEHLGNFAMSTQLMYWRQVAVHFDHHEGWLARSAVMIAPSSAGEVSSAEAAQINSEIGMLLGAHPGLRVMAPLAIDRLEFASQERPALAQRASAYRISATSSSIVSNALPQNWPSDSAMPGAWLRTDLPGLSTYIGAGADERDFRTTGALAYQRQVDAVVWPDALPAHSFTEPADEAEAPWMYPGSWFGLDQPVATLQLKWMRRVEQDFEYLWLARQRGQVYSSTLMARLLAKPVELVVNQPADPIYTLLTGTPSQAVWQSFSTRMASSLLSLPPNKVIDAARQYQVYLQSMRWVDPMQRPLLIPRSVQWMWDPLSNGASVVARLTIDIYNPSDDSPDRSELNWSAPLPTGWLQPAQATDIGSLAPFHVSRVNFNGRFDLRQLRPASRQPIEMAFTDGYTRKTYKTSMSLPIAESVRRERPIVIDGALEDWSGDDALHTGPLTKFVDRPGLFAQSPQPAGTPGAVYSNWSNESVYFAFKLEGTQPLVGQVVRDFVRYDLDRAWDEDMAQLLIQPIYADNSVGPFLHVTCKLTGSRWVEIHRPDAAPGEWQTIEGATLRCARTLKDAWRGEVAIPWKIFTDARRGRPTMLRFNFIQHRPATGESASWAGPIDSGRDDGLMGLLVLREPEAPGMRK